MVSINLRSSTFRAINEEGHYCVNILNSDQKDVAERFSGKKGLTGAERYAGSEWFALETGALALRGALASIDCWVEDIIRRHSHALVLGSVETIVMDVREKMPLTYSQGQYRSIT
jgi:flavin reductase (DIM6/NTAB) family NADH-FMN oxidoreductase RutF